MGVIRTRGEGFPNAVPLDILSWMVSQSRHTTGSTARTLSLHLPDDIYGLDSYLPGTLVTWRAAVLLRALLLSTITSRINVVCRPYNTQDSNRVCTDDDLTARREPVYRVVRIVLSTPHFVGWQISGLISNKRKTFRASLSLSIPV